MIHSLNQSGKAPEAVGYVLEQVDRGVEKVLCVVITEDGHIQGNAFGELTVPDLTLIATWLNHRAMGYVDGED